MKRPFVPVVWREMNYIQAKWFAGICLSALMLLGPAATGGAHSEVKQAWKAPKSARELRNPVAVTPQGVKAAAQDYKLNCVICHGRTGASNGPAANSLPQKPANFTDEHLMRMATDGELFWQISTGRAPMPSWQDKLSESQRWQLVNYLRILAMRAQYRYMGTAE